MRRAHKRAPDQEVDVDRDAGGSRSQPLPGRHRRRNVLQVVVVRDEWVHHMTIESDHVD